MQLRSCRCRYSRTPYNTSMQHIVGCLGCFLLCGTICLGALPHRELFASVSNRRSSTCLRASASTTPRIVCSWLTNSCAVGNYPGRTVEDIYRERKAHIDSRRPGTFLQELGDGRLIAIYHQPLED